MSCLPWASWAAKKAAEIVGDSGDSAGGAYLIDLTQSPIGNKILELFGTGGGDQVAVEGVTDEFWTNIPIDRPLMATLMFNGEVYILQISMLNVNFADLRKSFMMTIPMIQSGQVINVNVFVSQSNSVDIKAYVTVAIN